MREGDLKFKKSKEFEKELKQLSREAEEREAERLAQKLRLPYLNVKTLPVSVEALSLIPESAAQKARAAAVEINQKKQEVILVSLNPSEPLVQKIIKDLESKKYKVSPAIVSLSSLGHIFSFYQFVHQKAKEITGSVAISEKKLQDLEKKLTSFENIKSAILSLNQEVYVSELLEIILAGALSSRASDIHLEPEDQYIKLRFRVDGLLHNVFGELSKKAYGYLLSRVKLLSNLKINIHDEPQDGRLSIKLAKKELEVRVSTAPSEFGEVIVMRLLDPETISLGLEQLGLRGDDLEIVEKELKKPNGMILNTGPTGSGKTTTLYAFLKRKATPEVKIITIEDPIEYHLEGIEQTQVDEEAGYDFGGGLKSLMRQDPDIILVGEIRDKDTAETAIQAALTGHLVFSTVHANEASGAVPRLLDLGVRTSSIGPALNLIIAQRLVRRLCEFCKAPQKINSGLQKKIEKFLKNLPKRVLHSEFESIKTYKASNCEKCNSLGYKGRVGIFELLLVDSKMENLINKETSEAELQSFALKQGMVTMQQDGILKTISGITTFEEIELQTGPIEWAP